jgi:CDP-Glycerol:Poly(glycerophosphate) glycerophosphotransferase
VASPEPYDESRPAGLRSRDFAAAGVRLVYLPYAQALSAEPENVHNLYDLPLHNLAWRIYVASDSQLHNYRLHCQSGNGHVRSLGSIKNERLISSQPAQQAANRLRRALGTRTVTLWNPHWSVYDAGWSTFATNLVPILRYFAMRPDRGLILRPHPRLLSEVQRLGGGEQVSWFRASCAELKNVQVDEDYDHVPAMLAADSLISDLSSVIPEYLCLGRPTGYLRRPGAQQLNDDRSWLGKVSEISTERALLNFLNRPSRPSRPAPATDVGAGGRIVEEMLVALRAESRTDVAA